MPHRVLDKPTGNMILSRSRKCLHGREIWTTDGNFSPGGLPDGRIRTKDDQNFHSDLDRDNF